MPADFTFHLVGNAHLDPVWLWDWREGLNEGLITCRTILDLMDEDHDLTFCRGEAAIYDFIERTDPKTFGRIRRRIEEGRWDYVGGTWLQSDTNLPATETFARLFLRGQRYFVSRFGRPARIAWFADSFGHSAGLPEILAAAGIEGMAFTRPEMKHAPLAKPAFWWAAPSGARIMGYRPPAGWYGCERDEAPRRLDRALAVAAGQGLRNVGVFYGLGNHGGGPTRRQLREIRKWAAEHPEVQVVHSGLHRLFAALEKEVAVKGAGFIPTHRGELNFVLRGCYSSVAKFKYAFRKTEALVSRAEKTSTLIAAATGTQSLGLDAAWESVLFNSFHDILPGSSIERAYDDQLAWLGKGSHEAQLAEHHALNMLALDMDTSVAKPAGDSPSGVAALVWNPHPYPYEGHVEIEASLDYRPLWAYGGKPRAVPIRVLGPAGTPVPFQEVATEHSSMPNLPWRKRLVIPARLPAMGWNVFEVAYREGAPAPSAPESPAKAGGPGVIDNGIYRIEARAGSDGVRVLRKGKSVFGGKPLSAAVFDDPWGSWGAMDEAPESLTINRVRERWRVAAVETIESGPRKVSLWVRLAGRRSRIDLTFSLYSGRDAVDVQARILWNERSARLKLTMPAGDDAEFDVPGATVRRPPCGEVPGGRWVRVRGPGGAFGFASNALYNFDCTAGEFRATVCRASRYANDIVTRRDERVWQPAVDAGELRFDFLLTPGDGDLPRLAEQLEQPPVVLLVPPHKGKLGRAGSLGKLLPARMKLLALKAEHERDLIVRVQNIGRSAATPVLTLLGRTVRLSPLAGNEIGTWAVRRRHGTWASRQVDVTESLTP